MEDHRVKLLYNYEALTHAATGFDVNYVIDYLRRDDVIQMDEYEEILAERTTKKRAECLLDYLLQKDELAFRSFFEALEDNYAHFAELLANTPKEARHQFSLNLVDPGGKDRFRSQRSDLPALSAAFVGRRKLRERFLKWLRQDESSQRMFVFTGTPGIGKTMLMVTSCREYVREIKSTSDSCDQVLFFDLRSVESVQSLAIDIVISLKQAPGRQPMNLLCNALRSLEDKLVLVLDSAEHMMTDSNRQTFLDLVQRILESSDRVRLVMSSTVSVRSVSVDFIEERLAPLGLEDGVALSQSLTPSLSVADSKRVCELTGHLPLGIRLMSFLLQGEDNCDEIFSALEKSPSTTLQFIDSVDGVPMSSKLIPCFASCHRRLNEDQRWSMAAFSVFPTSFDRRAAQEVLFRNVCERSSALIKTQKILRSLEARSMLMVDERQHRYTIHALLRAFCEKQATLEEKSQARRNFCEYFMEFAEHACRLFYQKNSCPKAVQEFWSERQNILHAIRLCLSDRSLPRLFSRFASRKGLEFLRITLPDALIRKVYESLLGCLDPSELQTRIMVLTALGFYARVVERDIPASLRYVEEAKSIVNQADLSIPQQVFFMHTQAKTYVLVDRLEEAEAIAKESLQISMNYPDKSDGNLMKGFSVEALAGIHKNQFFKTGITDLAISSNAEYNAVFKYIDNIVGEHIFARYIHLSHGELRERVGNLEEALESYKKALGIQNIVMGECLDHAIVHALMAGVYQRLGRVEEAIDSLTTAFQLSCKILGSSERTKSFGEKLISLLEQQGVLDAAQQVRDQLSETMRSYIY